MVPTHLIFDHSIRRPVVLVGGCVLKWAGRIKNYACRLSRANPNNPININTKDEGSGTDSAARGASYARWGPGSQAWEGRASGRQEGTGDDAEPEARHPRVRAEGIPQAIAVWFAPCLPEGW